MANVPRDSSIYINFSERLDQNSVDRSVFISPVSEPKPRISYKGDAIKISYSDGLDSNTTYVITLGTDLRDHHNVPLDQAVTIAFSTGSKIDSGTIAGRVYRSGKPATNITMALFDRHPDSISGPIDSALAGYITQSGENGAYRFEYLSKRPYYLAAFDDRNKDRYIQPLREAVGVPAFIPEITRENNIIPEVNIRLHQQDTSKISIRSVTVNADGLLRLRLNRTIDETAVTGLLAESNLFKAGTEDAREIEDIGTLSEYPSSEFSLIPSTELADTSYTLRLRPEDGIVAATDSLGVMTFDFTYESRPDEKPPSLVSIFPPENGKNIEPTAEFFVRFTEPVDSLAVQAAFALLPAGGETSLVVLEPVDAFSFRGSFNPGLEYGRDYVMVMYERFIRDLAGNALGDSTDSYLFSTIGMDTLGQFSGVVRIDSPLWSGADAYITFSPSTEGEFKEIMVQSEDGSFFTDMIPGYYSISAYLDINGNGQYDFGTIRPYTFAEPFVVLPDTFRVRTRFETAGLQIEFK